jgi:hypothetical protein
MKTCLYTAIFGDYETLKDPIIIDGLDYVCFTDNKNLKSNVWDIRYIEAPTDQPPSLFYKNIKCLSHEYLPEYDTTIWLDANFVIRDKNYLNYLIENFKSNKIMVYKHVCLAGMPRDCAYEEGKYSMTMGKYSKEKISSQLNEYEHLHEFPKHNGLYQSGFIMRNNRDEDVIEFNKFWLNEIQRFGRVFPQCQVSLAFTLWKLSIDFDVIENIWDTDKYDITFHGNNNKFTPAYAGLLK